MSEQRFDTDGMTDEEIAERNQAWDEAEAREGKWETFSQYLKDMTTTNRLRQVPAYASMVQPYATPLSYEGDYPLNSGGRKAKYSGDKLFDDRLCAEVGGVWWAWRWNQ